jgi:hypothetical protein
LRSKLGKPDTGVVKIARPSIVADDEMAAPDHSEGRLRSQPLFLANGLPPACPVPPIGDGEVLPFFFLFLSALGFFFSFDFRI